MDCGVMGFSIPIRFVYTCVLWRFPCSFDGGRRISYDIEVMMVFIEYRTKGAVL